MEKYDFLADALQTNVVNYLKDWDSQDLQELGYFFAVNYMHEAPNEKQLEFITEFIGKDEWDVFDDEIIQGNGKYFIASKPTKVLVHELSGYILHICNHRFNLTLLLLKLAKSDFNLLKIQLRADTLTALLESCGERGLKVGKAKAYKKLLEMLIKRSIFTPEELENYS
jgi:hypothetical protein